MGNTNEPPTSNNVSTKLKRIAEVARELSGKALRSLAHHIDVDFLREAYARTRKDGATGIDGVTAREYERELEDNLRRLLNRFKSGTYKAPPVRRAYIPKADGGQRPLGVPDKTRLFRYRAPDEGGNGHPPTFDFLGFTHYWARSRAGRWVIKRKTIAKRLARKTHEIWMWCRQNRHEPLEWQRKRLAGRLLGYYNYFGIPCNAGALDELFRSVLGAWHCWLSRRSQRGTIRWEDFARVAERFPLPRPRIVHQWV